MCILDVRVKWTSEVSVTTSTYTPAYFDLGELLIERKRVLALMLMKCFAEYKLAYKFNIYSSFIQMLIYEMFCEKNAR